MNNLQVSTRLTRAGHGAAKGAPVVSSSCNHGNANDKILILHLSTRLLVDWPFWPYWPDSLALFGLNL